MYMLIGTHVHVCTSQLCQVECQCTIYTFIHITPNVRENGGMTKGHNTEDSLGQKWGVLFMWITFHVPFRITVLAYAFFIVPTMRTGGIFWLNGPLVLCYLCTIHTSRTYTVTTTVSRDKSLAVCLVFCMIGLVFSAQPRPTVGYTLLFLLDKKC